MSVLNDQLSKFSTSLYGGIADFFDQQQDQAGQLAPSLVQSVEQLRQFSLRGGKALRPFLAHISYEMASGTSNAGLKLALASLELHHKHLLIFDDIFDRDEIRYGGQTLERSYRNIFASSKDCEHKARSFAMFDGVLLGAFSRELLLQSKFNPQSIVEVFHILNTLMLRDTLAGLQIHALQADQSLSESCLEEFVKGLELVTARYTFEGPLKIGLHLAENTDRSLDKALEIYSKKVGTAFQIHDDILGLFGESAKTGKPVGNDVREGKKTLLLQIAYQRSSKQDQYFLAQHTGCDISAKDLKKIQIIVKESGSLQYSIELEQSMVSEGIHGLDALPPSIQKQLLTEIAEYVIVRDH